MSWKIGQKLLCIDGFTKLSELPRPKKGDVVTFDGAAAKGGFYLLEYNYKRPDIFIGDGRPVFNYNHFRPLLGESAKSELLSSFKEVTETSDLPIEQPQPETA